MPFTALHLLLTVFALLIGADQVFSIRVQTPFDNIPFGPSEQKRFAALQKKLDLLPQVSAAQVLNAGASRCGVPPSFTPGQTTTVNLDGGRKFLVYVPNSYLNRKGPVALQVLFHGLGDNCLNFIKATGFMERAEKDGYILASGCGTVGVLGNGWNAGTCCGFMSDQSPDDIKYATTVISTISAGTCVDPQKVMAVGFSNGAMLSEVLGCKRANIFRAVVSVAGVVEIRPGNEEGLTKCDEDVNSNPGGNRSSVLMIHGNVDLLVPIAGNSILGFPPIAANVDRWAKRNGCTKPPVSTLKLVGFNNTLYNGCESDAPSSAQNKRNAFGKNSPQSTNPGSSIIEIVHDQFGAHTWPRRGGFTATDYIYNFGRRVFISY